jgi:hypothetical protein
MSKIAALLMVWQFVVCPSATTAQHGTAPSGYYPPGFAGDMWTGEVIAVNDQTREITLAYRKKDRTETFTGVLPEGYRAKLQGGGFREVKVSEFPIGTLLRVYYMAKTRKVEGKKVKYYEIIALAGVSPGKH